jgi:hypothetical protein
LRHLRGSASGIQRVEETLYFIANLDQQHKVGGHEYRSLQDHARDGGAFGLLGLWRIVVECASGREKNFAQKRTLAITHGVGLTAVLVGGFGMLARLGIHWPWPFWVAVKFVIWVAFGAMIALLLRKPELAKLWYALALGLGFFVVYLGIAKPGM